MPEFILSITKEKASNEISEEFKEKQIQVVENDEGNTILKIRSKTGDYEGTIFDYDSENVKSGSLIQLLESSMYLKDPVEQYII